MLNVCDADVLIPPFAVPPLSVTVMVTTADPVCLLAGVKFNVPLLETAGWAEKSELLLLRHVYPNTVCADSLAGPGTKPWIQEAVELAPEFSRTVTSDPLVKDGC